MLLKLTADDPHRKAAEQIHSQAEKMSDLVGRTSNAFHKSIQ
jgi:hypothetical protein